ncbi:MAG: ATP-binding protein [Gemmatimonadaceae bacterium]|nr:ATP-binding protein [Gemmatimonadaceae bacterium]
MKLDQRLRFDSFVTGSSNRLAVAAAKAVADAPGVLYNPLFVYGASGLGKTHLMHAVGHAARDKQPSLGVEYVALDDYMEEFHQATEGGRLDTFKRRYESAGILLLDDVQFLTGRAEVQGELLRLFNVLQGRGTQIVMSSDRPPDEITDVTDRLLTRLTGGLIVDVGIPDYETRVAILQKLQAERAARFRDGVLEELARVDFSNIRELQGGLNRLLALQGMSDAAIGVSDVRRLVGLRGHTPLANVIIHAEAEVEPAPRPGDYDTFVQEVATAVVEQVEEWRVRLADAASRWRAEGISVAVLDRALQLREAPDVDGLLATFGAAVEYLRDLERQGSAADASLSGQAIFRDPERVKEAHALVQQAVSAIEPPPRPEPAWTFAGLHEGRANQLALRAARAVVGAPGTQYVPLVITGPSGSGRTHLLHAIGNALIDAGVQTVACVGASVFAEQLITALREGAVEKWRARYRNAGALLLDDIEAVAGKERTQDELFHLFNALQSAGRQVVLTSSVPPNQLATLEDRLRTRFAQGLVVELGSPDIAQRAALIHQYFDTHHTIVSDQVVSHLADRPARSVGDVLNVVRRLHAAAALAGAPITPAFVAAELDGAAAPRRGTRHLMGDTENFVHRWPDLTARLIEDAD